MAGRKQIHLENHLTLKQLDKEIEYYEQFHKIWKRLIFIRYIAEGQKVVDAVKLLNVTVPTGYNWLNNYNDKGVDGLIPKYGKGRPSYLSDDDKKELIKIIDKKLENNEPLSAKNIHKIIYDEFNVNYNINHILVLIRGLGYGYSKTYPFLYKKNLKTLKKY